MKAILIALALVASVVSAPAATIVVDLNPAVLRVQYPEFFAAIAGDGFYWYIPECRAPCDWHANSLSLDFYYFTYEFPFGTEFIYIPVGVPEPSTWALLLFGFAFFGLRQFWPGASHE